MTSAQTKVTLTAGEKTMTATLVDNAATRELLTMLQQGPITIQMSDYGGFEKVGSLPESLPTSDTRITTVPGDIMLYQGDNMVILYGSNTWSYTRLGKIDGADAASLRQFLGTGSITLTITTGTAGADYTVTDRDAKETVHDLNGRLADARQLTHGVYIINGRRVLIRR